MVMSDILSRIENVHDIDELSAVLRQLAGKVKRWSIGERTDPGAYQEAAQCLTRMRLILKELEKSELWAKGASRDMADRYTEMESTIRSVFQALNESMRVQHH
jgi:hypothetical protein